MGVKEIEIKRKEEGIRKGRINEMAEIERSKNTKTELPSLTGEPSLSFKNGLLLFIYLPIYVHLAMDFLKDHPSFLG